MEIVVGSRPKDGGERLVINQALAQFKNPQNQGIIPPFLNRVFTPARMFRGAAPCSLIGINLTPSNPMPTTTANRECAAH